MVFYAAPERQPWGQFLEAAPSGWDDGVQDPRTYISWCAKSQPGYRSKLPLGTAIGTGADNTAVIIKYCGPDSAGGRASAYRGGGQTDWFLPSQDELNQMYVHRSLVGELARGGYWSSTNAEGAMIAYAQRFGLGGDQVVSIKDKGLLVRPIRAF